MNLFILEFCSSVDFRLLENLLTTERVYGRSNRKNFLFDSSPWNRYVLTTVAAIPLGVRDCVRGAD